MQNLCIIKLNLCDYEISFIVFIKRICLNVTDPFVGGSVTVQQFHTAAETSKSCLGIVLSTKITKYWVAILSTLSILKIKAMFFVSYLN